MLAGADGLHALEELLADDRLMRTEFSCAVLRGIDRLAMTPAQFEVQAPVRPEAIVADQAVVERVLQQGREGVFGEGVALGVALRHHAIAALIELAG